MPDVTTTHEVAPQVQTDSNMSQEYIDKMTSKADAGLTEQSASTPESGEQLLAGKYKSEADLMKGIQELGGSLEDYYKSLEANVGSTNKDTDSDTGAEQEPQTESGDSQADADQDNNQSPVSNLDFDKYTSEFYGSGELTKESREEIINSGIPEALLDQYLEGLKALGEISQQSAYNLVGGKDQYDSMIKWAESNLSEAEKKVFNEGIASQDVNQRNVHIQNLYARFTQNGNPRLLSGDGVANVSGARYESMAQLTADINNPKYATDPAFRAEVEAKLARSNIM